MVLPVYGIGRCEAPVASPPAGEEHLREPTSLDLARACGAPGWERCCAPLLCAGRYTIRYIDRPAVCVLQCRWPPLLLLAALSVCCAGCPARGTRLPDPEAEAAAEHSRAAPALLS